jgi:hypothetical protein
MGKFAANDTGGWKAGVSGTKDSSGSFNMNDKPTFNEGDEIALVLYTGQDVYTLATALIESIESVVDVNDGPPVSFAVTFQGTSAVSESTGSYSP